MAHKWTFRARFRRNAFGWKSQPAIKRIREAVSEIKAVARKDKLLAAEGAVLFLEKLSPALTLIDSSSGAIGTAVNRAIATLVPIIAEAPADEKSRAAWLERLFEAHAADKIPYIESLAESWGDLCASMEVASEWADRLLDTTRRVLRPGKTPGEFFHGTSACLSALHRAERHEELVELLEPERFWFYRRWAVRALAAQGRKAEAIRYAEDCRDHYTPDSEVDRICEEILLSSGFADEAYRRYGLVANQAGTYKAWFRAVLKKYPHKTPREVLEDLVKLTAGEEGKWFAAAKDAGLLDEALALANRTPCSPQTLTRAARDFAEKEPEFALEAGMTALRWLLLGFGYEVTGADVLGAYSHTLNAADHAGRADDVRQRIRDLLAAKTGADSQVARILRGCLEQR